VPFFHNNGQPFLTVGDIYISRQHAQGHPPISSADYNTGVLPGAALATAYHVHGPLKDATAHDYSVSSYFGSRHYSIFAANDIDIGQAHDVLGRLLIQIEEIPSGTRRPTNSISTWRKFQREDALTGKGRGDVTRLMGRPQP
jgi:hypothetical protein